jgi:hypothetical protein
MLRLLLQTLPSLETLDDVPVSTWTRLLDLHEAMHALPTRLAEATSVGFPAFCWSDGAGTTTPTATPDPILDKPFSLGSTAAPLALGRSSMDGQLLAFRGTAKRADTALRRASALLQHGAVASTASHAGAAVLSSSPGEVHSL